MRIKYILWVICALLLLNTSATFAQEIGGTSTSGKVGFLEKEPSDKPPETSKTANTNEIQTSSNRKLPIVGSDENDLWMPIAMAFLMIGSGVLVMKKNKLIILKENFDEKTIISLSGVAVITASLLSASFLEVGAATVGNTSSGANIAFQPKKTPTNPVAPGDGKTPITPTTPGVPNTSTPIASNDGLTLDFVPALNFGTHYVDASTAHTWSAWAANDGSGKAIPQFMQVTDNRGTATGPVGWSVSLTQTAQFKGTKAGDLTNAVLTFNTDKTNTVVSTSSNKASSTVNTATNALVPGTAVNIFQADAGTGTGTNLLSFGAADGSSLVTDPETLDASVNTTGKVDPNITLSVPAGSAKVDTYTTTLNWNLYSAPGNA